MQVGYIRQSGELIVEEAISMEDLQNRLISVPVLTLPYAEDHFMLDTGTSNFEVRCFQLQ